MRYIVLLALASASVAYADPTPPPSIVGCFVEAIGDDNGLARRFDADGKLFGRPYGFTTDHTLVRKTYRLRGLVLTTRDARGKATRIELESITADGVQPAHGEKWQRMDCAKLRTFDDVK
jgi:hypothetical protein